MTDLEVRAEGSAEVSALRNPETGMWVGECDALGIVVEADSLDELHALVEEAITLLFADLIADGEARAFLEARGWTEIPDWLPSGIQDDAIEAVVPWNLIASGEAHAVQSTAA